MSRARMFLTLSALTLSQSLFGQNTVTSISPANYGLNVSPSSAIDVSFSALMDTSTFTDSSFAVAGAVSGRHGGEFTFTGGGSALTFRPNSPFKPAEQVTVNLSHGIRSESATPLLPF